MSFSRMKFLNFLICFNLFFLLSYGAPIANITAVSEESDEDDYFYSSEELYSNENDSEDDSSEGEPPEQTNAFKTYQNDSSNYEVIGDMIIRKDLSRSGRTDTAWPRGEVPYTFHTSIDPTQRKKIKDAMQHIINRVPCINFIDNAKRKNKYKYNLQFQRGLDTSYAKVGWLNIENQEVVLTKTSSMGTAVHEIIHALGFFHEHTRNDRNKYVTINKNNIDPNEREAFKMDKEREPKIPTDYYGVPYNYDSIMHYSKTANNNNNLNTIDVKPKAKCYLGKPENIGQRKRISGGDIEMIRNKYNCPRVPKQKSEKPQPQLPDEKENTIENIENQYAETDVTETETQTEATTHLTSPQGGEASTVKTTQKSPLCQIYPNCQSSNQDD